MTIQDNIDTIRGAVKGKDVREAIAQLGEAIRDIPDVSGSLDDLNTAVTNANNIIATIGTTAQNAADNAATTAATNAVKNVTGQLQAAQADANQTIVDLDNANKQVNKQLIDAQSIIKSNENTLAQVQEQSENIQSIAAYNQDQIDKGTVATQDQINSISSSLEEKANKSEVRKKDKLIDLNDFTERTINAIQKSDGTNFSLLAIPKNESVTVEKIQTDIVENSLEYEEIFPFINDNSYYDNYSNIDQMKNNINYECVKIECVEGEKYSITNYIDTEHLSIVLMYDESGVRTQKLGQGSIGLHENYEFFIPSGVKYFTLTNAKSKNTNFKVKKLKFINVKEIKENLITLNDFKGLFSYNKIDIEKAETIYFNELNTEKLDDNIYTSTGGLQVNEGFCTLYYELESDVNKVNMKNISIGVYGGAFLDEDKNWISSFKTDGSDIYTTIPTNTKYIALSMHKSNPYVHPLIVVHSSQKLEIDNLKVEQINPSNQFKGKKIGFLGTSVLFGQYATKSYAQECANKLGFTLKNFGVPGLALHTREEGNKLTYGSFVLSKSEYSEQGVTIPSSPIEYTPGGAYNDYYRTWENVFTEDNADIDLWVYAVAPNNSRFGLDDWNLFDKNNWVYTDGTPFENHRTTFIGSLLFIMDKMYSLNPNARMVFLLDSSFAYTSGKSNFEQLKSTWNIPIIDLWGKINISPKSLIKLKSKDGTNSHPSTFAHEIMGNMLANEILLYN